MNAVSQLLNQFLSGALVMACLVVVLFFARFWRQTHDRFFLLFAGAFSVLAFHWTALAFTSPASEVRPFFYLLRLLAFLVLLGAIVDKNRAPA